MLNPESTIYVWCSLTWKVRIIPLEGELLTFLAIFCKSVFSKEGVFSFPHILERSYILSSLTGYQVYRTGRREDG